MKGNYAVLAPFSIFGKTGLGGIACFVSSAGVILFIAYSTRALLAELVITLMALVGFRCVNARHFLPITPNFLLMLRTVLFELISVDVGLLALN